MALVGAGPGDPDLLTRRAATLLAAADVVLHDWLAGTAILELARPDATLIDVGKGKGCGASQRYIEGLLVAHHGAGPRVVRLKGGDPFLFGRGMEEVARGARRRVRRGGRARACRRRWPRRRWPASPSPSATSARR